MTAVVVKPMLPKVGEVEDVPTGAEWLHEIKWDGVRCIATVVDGEVWMQSRSAKTSHARSYPQIEAALALMPDCVIDGEIVVLDENGDSFGIPAGTRGQGRLIVFDLLEVAGESVRHLPLTARREALELLLRGRAPLIELSPEFSDGVALLAWVADRGAEGIVSKLRRSKYADGTRRGEWLKTKLRREQEFIVCGWTEGKNGNAGHIGGLVLGYYDEDGELVYAGRAGSRGEDELTLRTAFDERPWDNSGSPFGAVPKEEREATWVFPSTVVQVAFQCWSKHGRLTHPVALRIRTDKDAIDVGRGA